MAKFDQDGLKAAARRLAADGVERTPSELEAMFRDLIASYRRAAREAGRTDIADAPAAAIWDRIGRLAGADWAAGRGG